MSEAHADAPIAPNEAFPIAESLCRVVSNAAVNTDYRLLVADASSQALAARAGQFFHLMCPPQGNDQPFLRRPMSIYRVDVKARQITFLYKVTGAGTRGLASLGAGDVLNALGPLGQGFNLPDGTQHVLMLARGVGLATLAPLAGLATSRGARVTAVLSARTPELIMSEEHLQSQGARTHLVTDAQGTSALSSLESKLRSLHADRPFDFLATCGSNRLLDLLQRLGADWKIPGQVALEQHMGCGMGMCYACVRTFVTADGHEDYRRVCWDGPVFPLDEARPWLT
jgi:dihydroorotate dehydrogenase electron transfer subunit